MGVPFRVWGLAPAMVGCLPEQLVLGAEHYGVHLSSQVRKSKPAVLNFILKRNCEDPSSPGAPLSSRDVREVRLKEIVMQEKQMYTELALRKLEFQREREREQATRETPGTGAGT